MTNDRKGRHHPHDRSAAEQPVAEPDVSQEPEATDRLLEENVSATLGFLRWTMDDSAPLTDVQADYALRMSADIPVPAERLARIRHRVLRSEDNTQQVGDTRPADGTHITGGLSGDPRDGSTNAPADTTLGGNSAGEGGRAGARQHTVEHDVARGTERSADVPSAHVVGPRPSFWKRCRELKLQIKEVAPKLRLNDEVLLELEQGHARQVPRALLTAAASFVDFDAAILARCFAPNTGDVARMAAHDQSGQTPTALQLCDFLTIIEESELSDTDKQYWRDVVQAEAMAEIAASGDRGEA